MAAESGGCRLLTVIAAPQGWHRDIIRRSASPGDVILFAFNGATYQDQPTWLTWVHHYWRVLNSHVGRRLATRPVLGVVASPTCDLRDMPWRELAELP